MCNPLEEILRLRSGQVQVTDTEGSSRYCIALQEVDGRKTAYCFSTPVFTAKSREMVDRKFHIQDGAAYAAGSNAQITVAKDIRLANEEGHCRIPLSGPWEAVSEHQIRCGGSLWMPTMNGIACRASGEITLELEAGTPFLNIRANDKYFALMREKLRPFVTVSCIGTFDANDRLLAPAKIRYQKRSDSQYSLTVSPCSDLGQYVLFEVNLYEPKLFLDTTVESRNPDTNNAFGTAAFIGTTEQFGQQWLYSRLNYPQLAGFADRQICHAVLHIPQYNPSASGFSAYGVRARFCSFGSNWRNKIAASDIISHSVNGKCYQSVDITALLTDPRTHYMIRSEGLILKPGARESGLCAIATGDSCYAPQILEICYR